MISDILLLLLLILAYALFSMLSRRNDYLGGGDDNDAGNTCNITYYIEPSNLDPDFVSESNRIIQDSELKTKYNLTQKFDESADIMIKLMPREEMIKLSNEKNKKPDTYPDGTPIRFSWTYQRYGSRNKPLIYIDSENWLKGVEQSGLSLIEYRRYVILHEFMHALGFDHQKCDGSTAINGVCPVMYQSTRGCPTGFKCGSNITIHDYKKRIPGAYVKCGAYRNNEWS